jgi:hypothetical protein
LTEPHIADQPNVSELIREGWSILSCIGSYCTVWREGEERLLVWSDGRWLRAVEPVASDSPASQ